MIFDKEQIAVWLRACEDNASEVALLKSHQELQGRCDKAEVLFRRMRTGLYGKDLVEDVEGWLAET